MCEEREKGQMGLMAVTSFTLKPQLKTASFISKPLASILGEAVRYIPRVSHSNKCLCLHIVLSL